MHRQLFQKVRDLNLQCTVLTVAGRAVWLRYATAMCYTTNFREVSSVTCSESRLHRLLVTMLPDVEFNLSEFTEVAGIANSALAILESFGRR